MDEKDENKNELSVDEDAKKQLKRIIMIYNCYRPHGSLDMKTPGEAAKHNGEFRKHWKTYYKQREVSFLLNEEVSKSI